jgi:hypothetical protein
MDDIMKIVLPEPRYTLFNATREGLPEVISVNDSLLSFSHGEIFPWHLRISLKAKKLSDNGMPTPDESKLLFKITDHLEEVILSGITEFGAPNALFLARSTWNGWRELYFYIHDPEIAHIALQGLIDAGKHKCHWEYIMEDDPQWAKAGYIFQLYASASGLTS